ncbi:MAG: PIN domain-containing protein [Bifidobacteriaceae bacterium]|jgi:toxin-antitoxin system PIN domain toxin|nr:PIN domain-containing protein [Bifidobacteriaceae bacterium]
MIASLLDVNVLLALFDRDHVQHPSVADWFVESADQGWATCPVTENGFIRILSQPGYTNPTTTADAVARLASATNDPAHRFWPCDLSLTTAGNVDTSRLLGPGQVTDAYLLALAVRHAGRLVTLDRRVTPGMVPGAAPESLLVLGTGLDP